MIEKIIKYLKYSAIYLLLLLCVMLIFTSTMFYFNIAISKFHLIISILLSIFLLYILRDKIKLEKKMFIKSFILAIIILFLSTGFMSFVFDRSSDGNTYHKDAIGNLYEGWNPVKMSSSQFVQKNMEIDNYDMHSYDIWKTHYAKANWILEGVIYKTTDNIESGKAINLILIYIAFSFVTAYFYKKIGNKAFILGLAASFNPVSCNQLFTFYNDQLGASLLAILIVTLLSINELKDDDELVLKFFVLSLCFIIITNIKFNIMGYGLIFTFVFMIRYLYIKYKNGKLAFSLKRLVPLYILLFVISFGVVGYPTYIKNYLDNGNPFYPVYGENSEDIITFQQPSDFKNKNVLEKFYVGTFAKVNNLQNQKDYQLKIPFTFSVSEIKESASVDTRLGGFGIFASGLFIISLGAIITYLIKSREASEKVNILLLSGTTIFLILVISESWWARYSPQNYIFVLILLYILFKYCNKNAVNYLVTFVVFINSFLILGANSYQSIKESIAINKDLNSISNKEIVINFNSNSMTGILYNLNDRNIKYSFVSQELSNNTYYKYLNYEVYDEER